MPDNKDLDQKEKDIEVKHIYKVEKEPKDIREIYLIKRKELSYITSFEERYFALQFLIRTGLNLLPKNFKEDGKQEEITTFKEDIRNKLKINTDESKTSIYPSERITKYKRIERDSDGKLVPIFIYSIVSDESGSIDVETRDYKDGLKDCKEQQFRKLDDKLSDLDDQVADKLDEYNVIQSVKPSIDDILNKKIKKIYDGDEVAK